MQISKSALYSGIILIIALTIGGTVLYKNSVKSNTPGTPIELLKKADADADKAADAADQAAASARKAADSTKETSESADKAAKDAAVSAKDAAKNADTNLGAPKR